MIKHSRGYYTTVKSVKVDTSKETTTGENIN
jgi:hypothetical protein